VTHLHQPGTRLPLSLQADSQVFKELPVATALGSQDIQVTGYLRHMFLREKNKIQEKR